MFTIQSRDEVREKIISKAKTDRRIVSAAVIGSYAQDTVDRWSDIDLTFGVDEAFSTSSLINSWTDYVLKEFSGIVLFDVQVGNTTYRVIILPGCLQVDLSFSPVSEFGAIGPHFKLLYGGQYEKPQHSKQYENLQTKQQLTQEMFGYMVHHILRARFSAERNKLWQAEFWISETRNYALKLACISWGLNSDYGRGFDDLPNNILSAFKNSYVKELSKEEILRVIKVLITGFPNISDEVKELSVNLNHILNEISS
ncbi:MAG: nucleotidyltransferase domain-containing protein [Flavobacteriales bacterium]|nr:nucleotidyltransferase domain-containing protein [Flavobacteriales bacterium]